MGFIWKYGFLHTRLKAELAKQSPLSYHVSSFATRQDGMPLLSGLKSEHCLLND
jgi:hypothetical protein